MAQILLAPIAQSINTDDLYPIWADAVTYDNAVPFGGGSLADASDSSYMQLGAWQDAASNVRTETVSVDFAVPSGFVPAAYVWEMRAKTDADVLANPPTGSARRFDFVTRPVGYTDHASYIDRQSLGNAGLDWVLGPLMDPSVAAGRTTTPRWFTTYFGEVVDLNNPTDSGYWRSATTVDVDALTGDGLRLTFAWRWLGEPPYDRRRAWIDVFEFRLLVAGEYIAPTASQAPMCRRYPETPAIRSGVIFPKPRTLQQSARRGPGTAY